MQRREAAAELFAGEGEVRALCREMDWSRTPLGPVPGWSPTLRALVRSILASAFPVNLWCGEDLTLIYNDAYAEVLGAKHPEALGRPGYEVWQEIWHEIAPMFERLREGAPPVYREDDPFLVQRAEADGDDWASDEPNAWFTFSLSPVRDEEGSIVAFLNIVHETTGRVLAERQEEAARARAERAEARLLEVFDRAPAFLAVLRGPDYIFEYVNEAYRDLVGSRRLIGRPVFEALPETREQGFEDLLDHVVETGETFVGREVPIELASGRDGEVEQRYLDFVYFPLEEPDGRVSGVVAHGYDVTPHVQARNEAQRARTEAEEASRAKSRFLGTVSHELRTPINAVLGYAELLEEEIAGSLTEGQRRQVERIRASTKHLHMLVGDVLDLARVEAGRVEIEVERMTLGEAVEEALSLVRPQARREGLELDVVEGNRTLRCRADRDRVRQILVNLLSNAVKFTRSGGGIVVETGLDRPASGSGPPAGDEPMVFVRVSDTGVGIEPEQLETMFQPFTQGDVRASERSGVGLGLAISRQLAEQMEGRLTAESEPGEGSAFTLWLPRAD